MDSHKIPPIIYLLHEIKKRSECCLKNNEQTKAFIDKISQNIRNCDFKHSIDLENHKKCSSEDVGNTKIFEDLDYLENILFEKMQENVKLKALNERLLLNSCQKSHKIKELARKVSAQNERIPKLKEVSNYKDIIGRCNVEIQKLKRQISIERKKLQIETARVIKFRRNHIVMDTQNKSAEKTAKQSAPSKKITKNSQVKKSSFKTLDKIFIQKMQTLIRLSEEPNIYEETLDEPENLDSDAEETDLMQMKSEKTTKNSQKTKRSFKTLDEIFIEKMQTMIRLSEEPNIYEETLDEPENLDSDAEKTTKNSQKTKRSFKTLDEVFIQKMQTMIRLSEESNIYEGTLDESENTDSDAEETLCNNFKEPFEKMLKQI